MVAAPTHRPRRARRTRIGIDARFLFPRYPGIGRYVLNLARELPAVADNDEEIVALVSPETPAGLLTELREAGLSLAISASPPRSLRDYLVLPREVRRRGLALLHSPFWGTFSTLPCPWIVTIHDLGPWLHRPSLSPLARPFYRLGVRRAVASARLVLTVSQASRSDLLHHLRLAENRVVVTPEAADPRFQRAGREAVAALRSRLTLPRHFVLHVGSNRPHKNLDGLLRGWAEVERDEPRTGLVLAGPRDGRFADPLALARGLGLGRVTDLGPVPEADLPALYSAADVAVLPSLWEGFGLPVVEAMACGTAVACSRAPALGEVGGEAALYYDASSPEAIARTIRRPLADPELRRRLEGLGRRRAQSFSWRRTAEETLAAYRQVLLPTP